MSSRLIINQNKTFMRRFSDSISKQGNDNVRPFITNRNPRNLERLTIARKPTGYHLDKPGHEFWHRIEIIKKNRFITGQVVHNSGKIVVSASSNETAIGKHLYRANDLSAYINIARVLAQRCLESGITQMSCFINDSDSGEKIKTFLNELQNEGIMLSEQTQYKPLTPWTVKVMNKPWKVQV